MSVDSIGKYEAQMHLYFFIPVVGISHMETGNLDKFYQKDIRDRKCMSYYW